ncbi:DUF11 domain-containing protein [Desulfosudis oleivorans]|uniref:Conserved repeat domain n=1 Tax=Desulfosudis oleivorans (strain DSM 6200 / JCM 39069 / Hxd3) TaxID=96561 RepID=A9A0N9_DESOH|nr:DUF11 domain-containing protein [Desulfosudis oleivorans]ABW69056.1 conserved repeat domain [Desulfosudis oleivorans Hxd3]
MRNRKRTTSRWIKGAGVLVAAVMLLWAAPQGALADGTASGTPVTNLATVAYQVGGVDQTVIESSLTGNSTPGIGNGTATSFVVDTSLDLSVAWTDLADVEVVPGQLDQVLIFTVTNDGNATQDFSLSAVNRAAGDDFDTTGVTIFVESGATAGYQAGEDTADYIDELAADASKIVYIVSDIPAATVNGNDAILDLVAQVAVGGTAATQGANITTDDSLIADNPATVQTVFVDGAGTADVAEDGKASDAGTYTVVTAALEVTKSVTVISDPVNGTTNPKAIPGAVIEYEIEIENTGSSNATSVTITDSIPANTDFIIGSVAGDGDTISYSDDLGATWTYSPSGSNGDPDPDVDAVQIVFNAINSSATESATFRVEVE